MRELLPCPFCGGVAELKERDDFYSVFHGCDSCGTIETWWYSTEAEAIKAWNTRATHGTLTAEQVRDVLLSNLPHREYYSVEQTDAWQAIADEMNTRTERTCQIRGGECDQCGATIHEDACIYFEPIGEGMRTVKRSGAKFCPNCGAKVVTE